MKTHIKLQNILLLSLALILCAVLVRPTRAAPRGVIQDLINAAADGASIDIPAGTYTENLTIGVKNITLRGAFSTPPTTIIQAASSSSRVITATTNKGLRLENLTISGGHPSSATGGGVYAAGGTLQIVNCRITANSADYGGGIFLDGSDSSLVLSGSTVDNNEATYIGGAVYAKGSATLANTTLDANSANNHGGGLHANGSATLTGGTVSGNHALNGNGGGVNVNDGLTVSGTIFTNNTAAGTSGDTGSGGAVTQWNPGKTVSIAGAVFSGNTAQVKGGAVFIRESFLTLSSSSFSGNTVDSGGSGDVYGGGISAGGGLDGSGLTFTANKAICTGCSFSTGGGLHINRPSTGPSTITASTFDGNLAWSGSGISSWTNVQLTLTSTNFTNNGALISGQPRSGYGGGVNAFWVHGDQLLFQDNQVLNEGGGLAASHAVLTHSCFINNTASIRGGGVYANADFSGSNLLFAGNDSVSGSALYVKVGPAVLHHATIARPTQGTGTGIFIESGGVLELKNSLITAHYEGIRVEGTLTEDYNLYYNNFTDLVVPGTLNQGFHSYQANPLFANPAGGDYHLLWPSPAIALGANLGVTTDLEGLARTGHFDSGAYQFWASTYIPLIRK